MGGEERRDEERRDEERRRRMLKMNCDLCRGSA